MRSLKFTLIVFAAGAAFACQPVQSSAQIGSARILQAKPAEAVEKPRTTQIILGPALFIGVNENQGLVRTNVVPVIALEKGLKVGSGTRQFAQFGGFYYSKGNEHLFQLTGKYFVNRTVGLQGAYQTGSGGGNAFSIHGLFNVSSTAKDPNAKVPWDIQLGLGMLTPSNGPDAFSGFLQLSVGLGHNWTVDTSYWGVFPGGSNSINRLMLGLGYSF